jgi:hypothetical protein
MPIDLDKSLSYALITRIEISGIRNAEAAIRVAEAMALSGKIRQVSQRAPRANHFSDRIFYLDVSQIFHLRLTPELSGSSNREAIGLSA